MKTSSCEPDVRSVRPPPQSWHNISPATTSGWLRLCWSYPSLDCWLRYSPMWLSRHYRTRSLCLSLRVTLLITSMSSVSGYRTWRSIVITTPRTALTVGQTWVFMSTATCMTENGKWYIATSSAPAFSLCGVGTSSFHSCASLCTRFSFMSFRITSLSHLRFARPNFWCSLTTIFHVLITTSSSVFLFQCPPTSILHVLITTSSSVFLFQCPLTSIFHVLITTSSCLSLSVSTHFHLSCSHYYIFLCLFLSVSTHFHPPCSHYYIFLSLSLRCHNMHLSLASLVFLLMFATPALAFTDVLLLQLTFYY